MKVRMKLELDDQNNVWMIIRVPYGPLDLHLKERSPKLVERLLAMENEIDVDDSTFQPKDSGPF